ncbi:MAG TPA: UbiX family flavin prenyltransferase [Candidatus Polarisedimenticolia bacterium]|nr:UbiX family flavin prenyltransferase [Candidatus Polarisedimenticolia bacterium]
MKRIVLGVTGASGSLCARSLLRALAGHRGVERVDVVISRFALQTLRHELHGGIRTDSAALRALLAPARGAARRSGRAVRPAARVILHRAGDMAAAISSGSYPADAMVIVPCSGGTLAAVANGVSTNLLQRAAEVTLKEHRPLILAFRETPLSLVHIDNMQRAARAGAIIYPLTPAFYTGANDLDAIVEQFTARILDLLGLPHTLGKRWSGSR